MENIDALLAAVAQSQGFEDQEPVTPIANEPGLGEPVREGSEQIVVVKVPRQPQPRRVAGEKKKRGRAHAQLAAKPPASKRIKPEDEEEDVCFICFDGGSLVLCDCKGCPKAYHPACIKRDEAFFQSTAKWYCGWHICSVCRKASHYLCYTCSYSLCKGCAKDADFSCVRKNKGFCSICMKTIMLLENKDQANNESIQVDFDDITSWEYLFKVYWVALRDKLSLTLDELTQAQKPLKDMDTIVRKPPSSSNYVPDAASREVPISDSSTKLSDLNKPHADIDVDKVNDKDGAKPSMDERATDIPCIKEKSTSEPERSRAKCICKTTEEKEPEKPRTDCSTSTTKWATKDLLELVAHMKNGDTSPMEPFDVERLLLDYVKRYNLRDPLKKSQVICDQRLRNMFGGKVRVGHFEMLKILHSHFLVEEPSMGERATGIPCIEEKATSEPEESRVKVRIDQDTEKKCICKTADEKEPEKPRNCSSSSSSSTEWATEDLLELVGHMKNGDTSPMEPFDVERLLLDYVKRYNLRDPLKKSQVICDQRLRNMFDGKVRVGHFEMLKILHSHFLVKEPSMDERATYIPCIEEEATSEPEKSRVKISIDQDTEKKCICKTADENEPEKTRTDCSSSTTTEWATEDLLELVAHMKNGDTSPMEPFDVERLLLDYVKRYNLRDPLKKSQVICDQRLRNMFGGKVRVGHFEMLKILHSHFLVKEPEKSCYIPAGPVSPVVRSEMEVDGNTDGLPLPLNSKTRKMRKKRDEKAPTLVNLYEYAAIDVHNINLIYLRRKLMENLIKDHDNFINMVIGSIVRIIISSNDQQQDVHRLVQVVGTTKIGEPYKIGDRTSDVMLEVLNFDRKEVVPITAISDNEFTEDECIQLRQSIRRGLEKRFTVSEVQNKAMSLHPVRVNDCLEAEITGLNDLRDQASENGRKKELRGFVSKLHRLKSPGEHSRRISEIPEIHADPKMSPTYESEEDTKSGDNSEKARHTGVPQKGRKPISSNKKDKEQRITEARSRVRDKPNASGSSSSDKQMNQLIVTNSVASGGNDQPMQSPGLETSAATTSIGNSSSSSVIETENLWHYRDPNGKIQGPFAMMQLRTWSATGLFPPGMTIWTNHEQYDSLLLTYALNGNFNVASDSRHSEVQEEEATTGEIGLLCEVTNVNSGDSKPTEPGLGSNNNVTVSSENNSGLVRADEFGSWPQCLDLLKDNVNSNSDGNDVQACDSPNKMHEDLHHPRLPQNGEKDSTVVTEGNLIIPNKSGLQNQSYNEDHVGLPSKENLSSNDTKCESVHFAPDPDKPTGDISLLDLSSPTPRTLEIDQLDVAMQSFELLELLSPIPKPNNENQLATEAKQSEFCGYLPTPAQPPMPSENVSNFSPNEPNWQVRIDDIIEIDAFEEETVSDLFDEAAAREASFPSPTSAIKFARELEDCKDNDCFSSIEELSRKSDAFSSTRDIQLTSEPSVPCQPISFTTLDIPTSSSVHSSASNEVEAGSSEFHPGTGSENDALDVVGANVVPGLGSDSVDPRRGSTTVQGNINLVTVQGNVNLVLSQGLPGLGWETNQGTGWANPNLNPSPRNGIGSLPWDGQRMYGNERFSSPREWGGYQVGRPPRGRQPQYGGGGGYSRQIPKGQRVCKFYESGHCKKGAFCDYLHP